MISRQQHAVLFAEQQARPKSRSGRVRVEKSAGQFAGLQRGQLDRGRRLVELHPDAGKTPAELAQDARQDRGHREAGERDPDVTDLALRERAQFRRHASERA